MARGSLTGTRRRDWTSQLMTCNKVHIIAPALSYVYYKTVLRMSERHPNQLSPGASECHPTSERQHCVLHARVYTRRTEWFLGSLSILSTLSTYSYERGVTRAAAAVVRAAINVCTLPPHQQQQHGPTTRGTTTTTASGRDGFGCGGASDRTSSHPCWK